MSTRDYSLLASLRDRRNELDHFLNEIDSFLGLDVREMGTEIDVGYRKQLAEGLTRIQTFMSRDYGEINLENYSKYVQDQMKKHQMNLDGRIDEILTNITSSQFEARYGMNALDVARIIKSDMRKYNDQVAKNSVAGFIGPAQQGDPIQHLNRAFDRLYDKMQQKQLKLKDAQKRSKETMTIDAFQTVLQTFSMKEVQKLKWVDGKFELSRDYMLNQYYHGDLALFNNLGMGSRFFVLDKNMIIRDSEGRRIAVSSLNNKQQISFESMLAGKETEITRPLDALNNIKGIETESKNMGVYKQQYLHLAFGEGNNVIVSLPEAKSAVVRAYEKGGWAYKQMMKLYGDTQDPRFVDAIKKFGDVDKLDTKTVENALLTARLLQDAPHVLVEQVKDIVSIKDQWKRLRMPHMTKGRIYTPEVLAFTQNFYRSKAKDVPYFAHVADAFDRFVAARPDHKMKFISINDDTGVFDISARVKAFLGFKSGAIKPKGVHVEVSDNGGLQVWYDKTAIFYDASVDRMLQKRGVDGLSVKSGNKVNKYRESGHGKLTERFVKADGFKPSNTMYDDLNIVFNSHNDPDIIYLPLHTFNVTNISKEHLSKAGANMAVHFDHNVGISDWMGLNKKIGEFQRFLERSMGDEYAMTSLAAELLGKQKKEGDLMLSKVPVEHILQENGLLLDQWMGDVVTDKLFTYFFQGSKIATGDIGNSSMTPMAPALHHRLDTHDIAIRTSENTNRTHPDGSSKPIKVSRQKIIGSFIPDAHQLDQQFSFLGDRINKSNNDFNGVHDTGFFVKRLTYKTGINEETADFMIIPSKKKKDGTFDYVIRGNGYEINSDGTITDLNVVDYNNVPRKIDHKQNSNPLIVFYQDRLLLVCLGQ